MKCDFDMLRVAQVTDLSSKISEILEQQPHSKQCLQTEYEQIGFHIVWRASTNCFETCDDWLIFLAAFMNGNSLFPQVHDLN
ncbi:CLUMA_CG004055, isoform A [Clunio marinus]|uniref:CLUMA_CG004055, isoform A n=1 Tax=Clunio marinus TaxID=568069 RepID=A0A1J1HQG0_9DIPT|nr:CLUMA_CG004055, isoform A [Clunio marinus]